MKKTAQKGFSIIEVVLVAAVAIFVVITIANLPSSLGLVGKSKNESLAKEITIKAIEDARTAGSQDPTNLVSGSINDSKLASLPSGSGQLQISNCPANICTNGENLKQVTATVTWNESGTQKSVQITTLITKGGLP